jgi:hypothetical protein
LVIGDVLYAESGRAVPVVIKSGAAVTTNGRSHAARRFATISCLPIGFTRVSSVQQDVVIDCKVPNISTMLSP